MKDNNYSQNKIPQVDDADLKLVDLAAILWKKKYLILCFTLVALTVSIFYAGRMPNIYLASSTIFPISSNSIDSSLISQYARIVSIEGNKQAEFNIVSSTSIIETILKSRTFAERLVKYADLVSALIKEPEKIEIGSPESVAVRIVQLMLVFNIDPKSSLISISANTTNPELSYLIVKKTVELLQIILEERVLKSRDKNITILKQQVIELEKVVRATQNKFTSYQRKSKIIQPQNQIESSLNLYQNLILQKIDLEIELINLKSILGESNYKVESIKLQLEAIKKKIINYEGIYSSVGPFFEETSKSLIEYNNIAYELETVTKIYRSLLTRLASLKLQDETDNIFIEIIDPAIVPEQKSGPNRFRICVIGTIVGILLSVLLVFVLDAIDQVNKDSFIRARFNYGKKK